MYLLCSYRGVASRPPIICTWWNTYSRSSRCRSSSKTELGKHVVHIRTFGKSSYVDDAFWNVWKFLCHAMSFTREVDDHTKRVVIINFGNVLDDRVIQIPHDTLTECRAISSVRDASKEIFVWNASRSFSILVFRRFLRWLRSDRSEPLIGPAICIPPTGKHRKRLHGPKLHGSEHFQRNCQNVPGGARAAAGAAAGGAASSAAASAVCILSCTYTRARSSSSSSSSIPNTSRDISAISFKMFRPM